MSDSSVGAAPGETGWLATHRWKIALSIAIAETILAAFEGVSRWVLIVLGVLVLAAYARFAPRLRTEFARELAWIAAVSQALAILVAVVAFFVGLFVLVLAGLLALGALVLLFVERPSR